MCYVYRPCGIDESWKNEQVTENLGRGNEENE